MGVRFITPRRMLMLYLTLLLFSILYILFNVGTGCPDQADLDSLHFIKRELWERDMHHLEKRLYQLEVQLRQRYPSETSSIVEAAQRNIPTIYLITPTYARPHQKAELTRLKSTFLHVPSLHWIIVEDSATKTDLVANFLENSGIPYTHLNVVTPPDFKMAGDDPNWLKPRGVLQRNLALEWIRKNLTPSKHKGVLYFADDDNTYDIRIFEEMRSTRMVSVWPVGLVGYLRYESPVVKNGKVVSWFTHWRPNRPFAMDMAGFAINLQLFFEKPDAKFSLYVQRGNQESELLAHLVTMEELEPRADNCTKVLVWHTRTEKPNMKNEDKFHARGHRGSDPNIEV